MQYINNKYCTVCVRTKVPNVGAQYTQCPFLFFFFRILDPILAGKKPVQIGEIKKEDFEDKQQFEWQSERMLITDCKEASLM